MIMESVVTEWQPIETAPKDGTRILLSGLSPDGLGGRLEAIGISYFINGEWEDWQDDMPTHWMPLPKQPSAGA
jgi:hypothetical protein